MVFFHILCNADIALIHLTSWYVLGFMINFVVNRRVTSGVIHCCVTHAAQIIIYYKTVLSKPAFSRSSSSAAYIYHVRLKIALHSRPSGEFVWYVKSLLCRSRLKIRRVLMSRLDKKPDFAGPEAKIAENCSDSNKQDVENFQITELKWDPIQSRRNSVENDLLWHFFCQNFIW